jgi:DNA-binding GntR family transcriptional regulator
MLMPAAPARQELWEHVCARLREAILAGEIPAGANLVEADLADRFGVSRGPVREALRELAREGLVVDLPRRGTVVSTLSFADLREAYAIREGLETVAARHVTERATDAELADLPDLVGAMEQAWAEDADYGESLAADLTFHRHIVLLSGNERLVALYEQMLSQTQLLVRTAAVANPSLRLALRRSAHRDIVEALLARDVERARLAIEEHYAYAEERLFASSRSPGEETPPPAL